MGLVVKDDGWRLPDALWEEMEQFLPARKAHPLGCHNPRVPDRDAMNAILFVLRTGCQWAALDATGLCSHSSAHRRFQEWVRLYLPIVLLGWFERTSQVGVSCPVATGQLTARVGTWVLGIRL